MSPQHLSLIGFDDIPISRYTDPQLTTVRYPVMSMAKLATELALLGAAGKLDREATHCCDAGAPSFRCPAANCGADH